MVMRPEIKWATEFTVNGQKYVVAEQCKNALTYVTKGTK